MAHDNPVMFGPFRLDAGTESVWRDTEEIRLRPKTFALLRYLAEHPGRLVTKDELVEAVWRGVAVGDAALAVCVGEIRKALGDEARRPRFIERVHRRGYRFIVSTQVAPAGAPLERRLTNVPRQLTSFVGRLTEMDRVKAALAGSALVTLTGAGGVGKTRLAIQAAADLLPQLPHGTWLVDLAPLTDPDDVPQAVAATLDLREQAGRTVLDALANYLRPKRALLLLDNCEHLLTAAASLAEYLLRESPGLRILATSREGFGISGEALLAIPPLAVPAPHATPAPEALAAYEAIRLFADRAAAVLPDFALSTRNAAAVAEICRRLDGIPLAIELAAARAHSMAVDEIAARLDDRFRLLTGGSRTALPRHQTLRGALDWSHQLLSNGERVLLRRLAVFSGGFTLHALEHIGAGGEVAEHDVAGVLARLVERSLVVFDPSVTGEPRYRLLETIRQYAQGKLLDSDEADTIRAAKLEYYLTLAEQAETFLRGPAQMVWLARLGIEHDNLRAALAWSLTKPDRGHAGLRLAQALQWFWFLRGPVDEGRRWLERALSSPVADAATRAKALAGLGMLAWRADDFARAQAVLEESLALSRELKDESTMAFALHHLAHVRLMIGALPRVVEGFEESVSRFRRSGDTWGTAWSLRCLGDNLRGQGVTAQAEARLEESLTLFRRVGDQLLIGHVLFSLGAIAAERGDYERANALMEETQAIWYEADDKYNIAGVHRELGNVARCRGDHERAAKLYRASFAVFREIGDRYETGRLLESLAPLALARGRAQQAARILGAAEALRATIGAVIRPVDFVVHDRAITEARDTLGEQAFAAAFAAGRRMSPDDIIKEVCAATQDTRD